MSARIVLALVLLALPSRATSAAESIADLVQALNGPAAAVRLRARGELLRRKDPAAISAIVRALPGLDRSGRSHAQAILEALPYEKTRSALRKLLRAKDAEIRALAAAALFRKGDEAGIDIAARDVADPRLPPAVTDWVVVRLGAVRHPTISKAIRGRLPDAKGIRLRYGLLHVHWAEDRLAVPEVEGLAASPELDTRVLARAVLFRLGRRDVVPALARDLADPAGTDLALADVFRVFVLAPEPPETLETALLRRLASEREIPARVRILEELTTWRCYAALEPAERLIAHADPRIAGAAFGLIARLGGRSEETVLRKSLESPNVRRRVVAAEALGRLDDHDGVPAVVDALSASDVVARREAARVLGTFTLRRVVTPLIDALGDRDVLVRTNAWTGLRRVVEALLPYRRLDWNGMGYAPRGAPESRAAALKQLRAWWRARSAD